MAEQTASQLPVQTLGAKHPNDPTVTTLEQEDATVTPETIADATAARLGLPVASPAEPPPTNGGTV